MFGLVGGPVPLPAGDPQGRGEEQVRGACTEVLHTGRILGILGGYELHNILRILILRPLIFNLFSSEHLRGVGWELRETLSS